MKKLLRIFFIIFLTAITFFVWDFFLIQKNTEQNFSFDNILSVVEKPCSKSLKFSVGDVDPKFGISKEEFIALSKEAVDFWNNSSGKNVFEYNSEAEFKINLVFDERQIQTIETEKLENDLEGLKTSQAELMKDYEVLNKEYEEMLNDYEKYISKYEKRLKEYNEKVEYWNKKGGITKKEYEKLKEEQEELEDLYDNIEDQRKEINKIVEKTNTFVKKEKNLINEYNSELNTYRSRFGDVYEFEKGVFEGTVINIYQFREKEDLKLTIIHELGHYLGLRHTENSKSVMYYLIGDQDLDNPALTQEDLVELNRVCQM